MFLIIGAGYACASARMLTQEHIGGLARFAQEVAIPCLLFRAVSQLDLARYISAPAISSFYVGTLVSFVLGITAARTLCKRNWEDSIVIGFAAMFSNTVLLGLSVVDQAFGEDTLSGTYSIIAFHAAFCYLVGITAMELARGGGESSQLRLATTLASTIFRNPILVAILAGFAFNFLPYSLPDMIAVPMDMLARASLPVALFGLGGVLIRYRIAGDLPLVLIVCLISLVVHPTITWFMTDAVFELAASSVQAAVVPAAMAPGVNGYIFACMYNRCARTAASSILIGTAMSLLTASMWLIILQ